MGGSDIRHEFVLSYITLVALWFLILTPALAQALTESPAVFNNSSYSFFVNNSSSENITTTGYSSGSGLINAYVNFHMGLWWLDVLIISIGGPFGGWVLVTVFGGIGG